METRDGSRDFQWNSKESSCFSSRFDYNVKGSGITECQFGQSLAIHLNAGFVGQVHKSGVGKTSFPNRCIDPLDPQSSHISLLPSTVVEGVETGLHDGDAGKSIQAMTPSSIALRFFHQPLSAILM